MTCIILFIMNLIPGLSLRVTAEEEEAGLDISQGGEFAFDYIEITRNVSDLVHSPEQPLSSQGSVKSPVTQDFVKGPATEATKAQ